MLRSLLLVVFFTCFYGGVFGQFIEPVFNFSKKQLTYIQLENGEELEANQEIYEYYHNTVKKLEKKEVNSRQINAANKLIN